MNVNFNKKHIFIVDDEPRVLKAVAQTIAVLGCTITCFSSSNEALEALKASNCDLLITDIRMPGLDGFRLMKLAKELDPILPVVIMTGYGDVPMAVRAMKEGATDFVEKPLDEKSLLPVISSALESENPLRGLRLSDVEKDVMRHLANGLSNKEIAEEINRSTRSIENIRFRLMKKLSLTHSADLVKLALRLKLTV